MQIKAGSISFTVCATLQKYWRGIVAKNLIKNTLCFEKTNFANLYMNFAILENFAIKYDIIQIQMMQKKI